MDHAHVSIADIHGDDLCNRCVSQTRMASATDHHSRYPDQAKTKHIVRACGAICLVEVLGACPRLRSGNWMIDGLDMNPPGHLGARMTRCRGRVSNGRRSTTLPEKESGWRSPAGGEYHLSLEHPLSSHGLDGTSSVSIIA